MSGILINPFAVAAPSGWQTTYSKSLITASPGWNGFNMRQVIGPSALLFSGSQVRVTLQASSAAGFTIDHAEIGHAALSGDPYDFDGTQVPLLFSGGSAGVTVGTAGTILSDAITYSLDKTKSFIVAVHFSATSATMSASPGGGSTGYFKSAANEVSVSDVTGYTTGNTYLIPLIEAFV